MKEQNIVGHLEELRSLLIKVFFSVIILFPFCYYFSRPIIEWFKNFSCLRSYSIIYIQPLELFFVRLKIAFFLALFIAFPYVAFQVWKFVSPALFKNEQFYPEKHGTMTWSSGVGYAPESLEDDKGRRIMWAGLYDTRTRWGEADYFLMKHAWDGTMTLPLTPEVCAAAYDFLQALPPFKTWKLPSADDIEFRVKEFQDRRGEFTLHKDGHFSIAVNHEWVGFTDKLVRTMAHEMIHVRIDMMEDVDEEDHGPVFMRLAARVCKIHGWDPKGF